MSVQLKNLCKEFGEGEVLSGIDLTLREGELTALLGPSGGGKTTLLRIVAGLEQPTQGEVYIGDRRVDKLPPQERGVGLVFQNYALFKHMRVYDNIAFGLRIRSESPAFIDQEVNRLLELVDLRGLGSRYPHQLSGGQRQRVALARALAPQPDVLLLDEPFAAVDAQLRRELRAWIRSLQRELSLTTIFVTHDQQDAMEMADRVAVINNGRLEQEGTPREVYENPVNSFVASFIGGVLNRCQVEMVEGRGHIGCMILELPNMRGHQQVEVAIRPSDLALVPCDPHLPGAAIVADKVFLGDYYRVQVDLAGLALTAHVPVHQAADLDPGMRVMVKALRSRCFIA